MIGDTYFTKFPTVSYANNTTRNITERVKILHSKLIDPSQYYPVTIGPNDRADVVAFNLYQDSYKDWLLWLNNNMVDPYYDWHLNDGEFAAYIVDKYGSMEFAEQHIEYYRTAWPVEPIRIDIATYNNTIAPSWQKYFKPFVSEANNAILYYEQSSLDWRMSTNQLQQWTISMTGNAAPFALGNVVQLTVGGGNVVGQGQVLECNSSILIAQHISGNTVGTAFGVVDAFNSTVTATCSNTQVLQTLIPLGEAVFWEGVTSYMLEEEGNAYKRFISVIDPSAAMSVSTRITGLLQKQ